MQKRLLSVDWDYFFPSIENYDWGANEEQPIFFEIVWRTRCSTRNPVTKQFAIDEYKPTVPTDFWKIVTNVPRVYLADSHAAILQLMSRCRFDEVVNLDAHHDYNYEERKLITKPTCANWAKFCLDRQIVSRVHLFYPLWRKSSSEAFIERAKLTSINFGLPKPQDYDAIFICRSSCWTPTWYDDKWNCFVDEIPFESDVIDGRLLLDRSPNMEQALAYKKQMDELIAEMIRKK